MKPMKQVVMKDKINLFFAVDNNYCPFLSSTFASIIKNANKKREYHFYVLHMGIKESYQERLKAQVNDFATLTFVDMKDKLAYLSNRLVTRDYYTKTTYYRLFIPNMFKQLNKALYLDCDIIVNGDIAKLYDTDLRNNLVGAVPDSAVQNTEVFKEYVGKALGIKSAKYFNAGVLLMNLKEMRKFNFEEKFIDLLSKYTFNVAQDQDYLNVLTKNRVRYINYSWNVMPILNNVCPTDKRNLIHYNMLWKPWMFKDTLFSDNFWEYANACPMNEEISEIKKSYTKEKLRASLKGGKKLLEMAQAEIDNPRNYNRQYNFPSALSSIFDVQMEPLLCYKN